MDLLDIWELETPDCLEYLSLVSIHGLRSFPLIISTSQNWGYLVAIPVFPSRGTELTLSPQLRLAGEKQLTLGS